MRAAVRTTLVAVAAGASIVGSTTAAFAGNATPAPSGVPVTAEGLVKPNSEIEVTADCPDGPGGALPTARAWTNFGAYAALSPMADRPYLGGTLTVPNIVPDSPDDENRILVTCSSGDIGSTTLPLAGNG